MNDDDLVALLLTLIEDEERSQKKHRCGSMPSRQVVPRDMHAGNLRIVVFRRRFIISKPLFLRIVQEVEAHDDYFR